MNLGADGWIVIEARCMPFADESLPQSESMSRVVNRAAIESIVRLIPQFAIGGSSNNTTVDAVIDTMMHEVPELEGLYFQTMYRMEDVKKESFFPDDDDDEEDEAGRDRRPAIAMKFDAATGRLVALGMFPLAHGFHPPR